MYCNHNIFASMMEASMGMVVGRQMIGMMNEAMKEMNTPEVKTEPQTVEPPQLEFFFTVDGRKAGPFSEPELQILIQKGYLDKETLTWHIGLPTWVAAKEVAVVNKALILNKEQ